MTYKVIEILTDRELEILRLIDEGFSDREIAQKLYLSINTVKWHNRQIYSKLSVSSRGQAVAAASEKGMLKDKTPEKKLSFLVKKHNLPSQISSFIGRTADTKKIIKLLETNRLITLTGPGGVGKTRLALKIADQLFEDAIFKDGIFYVELAVVTKAERIGKVILDSVGLQAGPGQSVRDSLVGFLENKKLLLVTDNFEHLLEGIDNIRDLLESASELSILSTSREPLKLSGEQIYPVQPLEIKSSEELFLARSKEVNPAFNPSKDEITIINQICARLDCLPLAIELAAARMNLFSPNTLLDKLDDRFEILTESSRDAPVRHQTLQKVIDWSYDLLTLEEKIIFNRLSVFLGSRTIEGIESVCCFDLSLKVLDALESLYAKNLIRQETGIDGELRFFLLETIHEYSRNCLQESGEARQIFKRHANYFTELAEEAKYPSRGGPDQIHWLKRLEADHDNLRAMYEWAMKEKEYELALRMVGCLDFFWLRMGSFDEALQWVSESIEVIDEVPKNIQADVYGVAGYIQYLVTGEREESKKLIQKALKIHQSKMNKRDLGWIHLHVITPLEGVPDEREEFMEHLENGLSLLREEEDYVGIARALTLLGVHEHISGNRTTAYEVYQEGLDIARNNGDIIRENVLMNNLAFINFRLGNLEKAQEMFKEVLMMHISIGHSIYLTAGVLSYLAVTAVDLDKPERATKLLGASDMLYKGGGYTPQPPQIPLFKEYHNAAQAQLEKETFKKAWAEGQAMSPEEAIAFALEELPDDS